MRIYEYKMSNFDDYDENNKSIIDQFKNGLIEALSVYSFREGNTDPRGLG